MELYGARALRGTLARRPELDEALLSANRTGDQIVITKLDRLGRSLEHLLELSTQLQDRGVDLVVLDQGINTSTALGRMFFQILGSMVDLVLIVRSCEVDAALTRAALTATHTARS